MDRKITLSMCVCIVIALLSLGGAQASTTLQGTGTANELSAKPTGGSLLATNSGPNNPQARIGSDFTYQGRLLSGGNPANGQHDFLFSLWDALSGGNQVTGTLTLLNVTVTGGLFTVHLDFGASSFQGQGRWLQIAVRQSGAPLYTILTPRQEFSTAPYALSLRAGAVITGSLSTAILSVFNEGGSSGLHGSSVDGSGVFGESVSSNGVRGLSEDDDGVFGHSVVGYGVHGTSDGDVGGYFSSDGNYGVYSISTDAGGRGVLGKADNGSNAIGVYGTSQDGYGLYGYSANRIGVYGLSNAKSGSGVYGTSSGTDGAGVYGTSNSTDGYGVYGINSANGSIGVYGTSTSGVAGVGVYGQANDNITNGTGVVGQGGFIGVWATIDSIDQDASALIADGLGSGNNRAGLFLGDVEVNGSCCAAGSGTTRIDHPLDPTDKYLNQSLVESPDMKTVYDGNVTTDANGKATVTLPDYVEALNRDFRYQLTVIGQFAQAIVSTEIKDHSFTIKTDKPNVKVSWQVTGIRQDPYANANRTPIEEKKPAGERGTYLYATEYGESGSKSVSDKYRQKFERMRKPVLESPQKPSNP